MRVEINLVVEDKDITVLDFTDEKKRSDIVNNMQGLQKSDAWKYVKAYFSGELAALEGNLDSGAISADNLIRAMGRRKEIRFILAFPELMLAVAKGAVEQEMKERERVKNQPIHPMAPNFGGKKKE